jgi:hypothetical protein
MNAKYIKLSRLNIGDIFLHKGIVYEIVKKDKWTTECKYINDAKPAWPNLYPFPKYLYCSFSNYIKVEI